MRDCFFFNLVIIEKVKLQMELFHHCLIVSGGEIVDDDLQGWTVDTL